MKKSLIVSLAVALFWSVAAVAQSAPDVASNTTPKAPAADSDTVVEDIIARVNNDIITHTDFERGEKQMEDEAKQQFGEQASEQIAKRQPDVLRDLIDQDLLVQKGKDLGINADDELIKRLDEIRKKMGLDTMDDLEKAAQEQGVSYEDFKNNLRNQIITQNVISQEVGAHIQMTREEEQKFYDAHKDQLEQPEQVRLSEILIGVPQPANDAEPDPQQVAAAQAKADDVEKQLKAGAKFEDLAKKFSEGPTAQQGGDLGYFKRGALAKQLEDTTFAMKAGEVSQPIRTKQGFVILAVTEHPAAGLPPLSAVRGDIDQGIYLQKLQPALREYLKKLREEAYIKIKPGYTDSGASPNQTEPIIMTTAAASEQAKAKKKKKKLLIF